MPAILRRILYHHYGIDTHRKLELLVLDLQFLVFRRLRFE
jgi:hypothetical protein